MDEHIQYYRRFSPGVTENSIDKSCSAMADIISTNERLIRKHLLDEETHFNKLPPVVLLSMIVTNITMNLFTQIVPPGSGLTFQIEAAKELMDMIGSSFIDCLEKIAVLKSKEESIN